jgi:GNAT superfamily N-acetyltransferase
MRPVDGWVSAGNFIADRSRPPDDAGMTIRRLDPADSVAMGRWYDLRVVVTRHDLPDFPIPGGREHMVRFDYPWPTSTEEALLAWDSDRVVGAASYLLPRAENSSVVHLELIVDPRYRRRGIGTRLLTEAYAAARGNQRGLLEIETVRALPAAVARDEVGYRYLTHRGHQPSVTSIRSRCPIADPSDAAEAALTEAWTHAGGYSLVRWRDAVPDEIIGDVAALQNRLMLDAPTGDLTVEHVRYDADRLRTLDPVGPRPPVVLA